ncbi:probable serine/threonine-protein kinase DDB_G0272254 [Chrysoperla carnea]|uniref:probable serine/threonine-protein kinase DDB_G0272254 n=1 Tax=Chrysoperla carnea TaxID=189513 RepID=UPI001D06FA02|nr:probable serine/threonine-protein kinase DDB_G0272254 [Chrysoperla carnea]
MVFMKKYNNDIEFHSIHNETLSLNNIHTTATTTTTDNDHDNDNDNLIILKRRAICTSIIDFNTTTPSIIINDNDNIDNQTVADHNKVIMITNDNDNIDNEIMSTHDYENMCAVNINRAQYGHHGLRSWQGYTDIDIDLHDDSTIHDKRSTTNTSTWDDHDHDHDHDTCTTISSSDNDNKYDSIESIPALSSLEPINEDDEFESLSLSLSFNNTTDNGVDNNNYNKYSSSSLSTLVATIDEIRRSSTTLHHYHNDNDNVTDDRSLSLSDKYDNDNTNIVNCNSASFTLDQILFLSELRAEHEREREPLSNDNYNYHLSSIPDIVQHTRGTDHYDFF